MGRNKGKAEGNRGRRGRGVMSYKERYRSTVVEDERIIVYRSCRLLKTMTVQWMEARNRGDLAAVLQKNLAISRGLYAVNALLLVLYVWEVLNFD